MNFSGSTQYTRAYHSEPKLVFSLLLRNRLTSVQLDGEILNTLITDDLPLIREWIEDHVTTRGNEAESDIPLFPEIEDAIFTKSLPEFILKRLRRLARTAMNGKLVSSFSPAELFDIPYQRQSELDTMTADSSVNQLLKKWRHINPKAGKDILTKEAMTDLEIKLKDKWLERLLSHFLKVQTSIPKLKKFGSDEDMVLECKSLFGKRRWRTIKKYTINLETILKTDPDFIPWDEEKVRKWLNRLMEDNKVSPNKLSTLWNSIRPLSHVFDFIDPDGISDLKAKMERTMDGLSADTIKQDNRAMVPCLELVRQIEMLSKKHQMITIRYYAACIRFAMATSARGNDLQHTCPSTWRINDSTRELRAWQTKITSINDKRPVPLVSPLHSFTKLDWWTEMDKVIALFATEDRFKDIDFLFPALTKDRSGSIPRPASNAQIMRIIRDELCRAIPQGTVWKVTDKSGQRIDLPAHKAIQLFTFAACRVLIPEWSHLADLPQELRRWLGRWREDSTADRYTRNHRGKIIEIMSLLDGKEDLLNTAGEVPGDISEEHYLSDSGAPSEMVVETDNTWQLVPSTYHALTTESPSKAMRLNMESFTTNEDAEGLGSLEDIVREDEEEETWFRTRALLLKSLKGSAKFPATQLPEHLDGPLSLVKTKIPSGPFRLKKIHLALTTRITVGCGMKATRCDVITENEMIPVQCTQSETNSPLDPRLCARCFKFFYWDMPRDDSLISHTSYDDTPDTLATSDTGSDSMPSGSDNSSNSNDSESEKEALRPPS